MAMVDLLCHAKEMALTAVNPHLMTIATLTGKVCHVLLLIQIYQQMPGKLVLVRQFENQNAYEDLFTTL